MSPQPRADIKANPSPVRPAWAAQAPGRRVAPFAGSPAARRPRGARSPHAQGPAEVGTARLRPAAAVPGCATLCQVVVQPIAHSIALPPPAEDAIAPKPSFLARIRGSGW